jgi:excisionase family DNA binding protein
MNPSVNPTGSPFFDKLVWTVRDVTEFLQCSERHVRQLVAENKIPHARMGRLVRFHKDRVVNWVAQGGTQ